jgi:hypothetical protein
MSSVIDILTPTPIRQRRGVRDWLEDRSWRRAGALDEHSFHDSRQLQLNPVEVRTTSLILPGQIVDPRLIVKDPKAYTDPIERNGIVVDAAFDFRQRYYREIRRSKNLRVTMGRDQIQRCLMMGDVGTFQGAGAAGALTAVTATTATPAGGGLPTAAAASGNTGLQGMKLFVGPNNSGVGSAVFGVIMSNTATVITVDQWYAIPVTGAAGTTPNATGNYFLIPGNTWAAWVGLSTSSAAAAAADVLRTTEGLFGDGTTGGAATEQTASGLARAYCGQGGTTAPTFGSGTYVLAHTWTYTGSTLVTIPKVVMCNSLAAAGSLLFLETLLNAQATVNTNGDTIQLSSWTVTL